MKEHLFTSKEQIERQFSQHADIDNALNCKTIVFCT